MKKQVAVFTLSYNERYWLPVWVRHYTQQGFDTSDIYVLDNTSTDGSTSDLRGCLRLIVDHDRHFNWDHRWMTQIVKWFRDKLLDKYDYVVLADSDECICVDPSVGMNLREFIDTMDHDVVDIPFVYVLHDVINNEPSLDLSKPILEQRSLWLENIAGKSLITRVSQWCDIGFHDCFPRGDVLPELRIVHLRWADRDITVKRVRERLGNDAGDPAHWGTNDRIKDSDVRTDKELREFLTGSWPPQMRMWQSPYFKPWMPVPISDKWKSLII